MFGTGTILFVVVLAAGFGFAVRYGASKAEAKHNKTEAREAKNEAQNWANAAITTDELKRRLLARAERKRKARNSRRGR